MFKNHLAMIGFNETPNKKAKFWQSYIRSLKGSEDIRANEGREDYHRTPFSIYDEPSTAAGRITVPGYRYLPVHRETYGYSPRNIYSRPSRPQSLSKAPVNAQQAFDDHAERMKELERRYPSRYGLYLRDKHAPIVINEEYEPDTKPKHA